MVIFNLTGRRKAMRNLGRSVLLLCGFVMGLAASGVSSAATGAGPYYATPSWDQTLPASTRFIDLSNMPGAVLDRETGLVWEKAPSTSLFTWFGALFHCGNLNLGGRTGWRLPARAELLSIVDRSQSNPSLPSGHPFTVQSSFYWSATTSALVTTFAWVVSFGDGSVVGFDKAVDVNHAWCVRGGPGVDPQ
jgi:hypothetical protein